MSDLVKRLRDGFGFELQEVAADRIERLEAVLVQAREALSMLNGNELVYTNPIDVDDEIAAIDAALKE